MKRIILQKVKLLASGDWRRLLASKIEGPRGMFTILDILNYLRIIFPNVFDLNQCNRGISM